MTSDKAMYWLAVGVLGLGAINGFVTKLGESVPRFVDRSAAMVAEASEAAKYVVAGFTQDGDSQNFDLPQMSQPAQVRSQARLACIQAAGDRASMARMQAERIRVQVLERRQHSVTWPGGHILIDAPQVRIEQRETFRGTAGLQASVQNSLNFPISTPQKQL